jgi:predicted nucleotidyltransferase
MRDPTPYPELNAVLREWLNTVREVLGDNFLAAYLQGSFALGDFDEHSDVDFLVALREEVSEPQLAGLQAAHARIYDLGSDWAKHLEGSYYPEKDLRRCDPASPPPWFLDNTFKVLARDPHDNTLVVRWVTRESGISLAGPDPKTLIDPVAAGDLKREVRATMRDWGSEILADPARVNNRWYQPYAVLSYCRMLHTLHTGTVESKPASARWAESALDPRWKGLIRRAWAERPNPSLKVRQPADPTDLQNTFEFIENALQLGSRSGPTEEGL